MGERFLPGLRGERWHLTITGDPDPDTTIIWRPFLVSWLMARSCCCPVSCLQKICWSSQRLAERLLFCLIPVLALCSHPSSPTPGFLFSFASLRFQKPRCACGVVQELRCDLFLRLDAQRVSLAQTRRPKACLTSESLLIPLWHFQWLRNHSNSRLGRKRRLIRSCRLGIALRGVTLLVAVARQGDGDGLGRRPPLHRSVLQVHQAAAGRGGGAGRGLGLASGKPALRSGYHQGVQVGPRLWGRRAELLFLGHFWRRKEALPESRG